MITSTIGVGSNYTYLRTYAVNERKYWRWYGNFSSSRTRVGKQTISERYDSLLQGDYKLLETDYLFLTLDYERDTYNGIRHRLTETLGYGHRIKKNETWQIRLESGLGFRHTIFSPSGELTNVPIINLKGTIHYNFTEKTFIEQILSMKAGEDTTVWTSDTSLEQAIVDNFALKIQLTAVYNDKPPDDVQRRYSISRVVLIYNF